MLGREPVGRLARLRSEPPSARPGLRPAIRALAAAACCFLPIHLSSASATELQAGLWKVTTSREQPDGKRSEASVSRCLTPDHVQHLDRAFLARAGRLAAACRTLTTSRTGDGFAWRVSCGHRFGIVAAATYKFEAADHFTAVLRTMSGSAPATTRTTFTTDGRRIGECPR